MRLLVTGGAGFIGSHLAQAALSAGHEVAVLDDFSTGKPENVPGASRVFRIDLRDADAVSDALAEFRPECVSHQAAQASVVASMRNPKQDVMVNVVGSLNLLDACVASGVKRVVFASTGGAIYGEVPDGQAADESWPPRPLSPYAISKFSVERLLEVYRVQHGIDSIVLRYANVYGPRQSPHGEAGVVAIFMQRLLDGLPLQINARTSAGDAGCVRDYVFVGDVVEANLAALGGQLENPMLNVGTGVATNTRELAAQIMAIAGRTTALSTAAPRAGDLQCSVLDCALARKALPEPRQLSTGLRLTWEWFEQTRA